MSSSFSRATRQLDDEYECNMSAESINRACTDNRYVHSNTRSDQVGSDNSHGAARQFGGRDAELWTDGDSSLGVDNSHRADRQFAGRDAALMTNRVSSDRYSYRRPSFSRSDYPFPAPVPVSTRRREYSPLQKNDSIRWATVSQKRGMNSNFDAPSFKDNDMRREHDEFTGVNDYRYRDSSARKSIDSKPIGIYGSEYGEGDVAYRQSSRSEIQPGFQCVQYDGEKADHRPKHQPRATMIEVSPGEFLRLRGADETWRAIHDDFFVPCACVCCEMTLFCIQDAVVVLCPQCLIVSPLEGVVYDGFDGGVGMGFTMESLAKWQEDIKNAN